jgi:hypothetical protein
MPGDWDDEELLKSTPETVRPGKSSRRAGPWFLAALLVAAAGLLMYVAFGNWTIGNGTTTAGSPAPPVAARPSQPLGGDPMSVAVPPLDESDAVVGKLLETLSSHPRVLAWLATKGLIRNFTVVVSNIAEGKTPATLVPVLRPASRFNTIERGTAVLVDPESHERYTPLAEAVASLDPAGTARLYATLKPRIEEADRDLGNPEPLFDRTLERAIVLLLATPVLDNPVAVEPRGIGYGFADERLESLTAAQKQLLRMGPQNTRIIQRSLRGIALALGIPSGRLGGNN